MKSSNIKPKPAIAKKPANIPKVNYQLSDGGPPKSILKKISLYDTEQKNGNDSNTCNAGNNNGSKANNYDASSSATPECKGAIRKNKCDIPSSPNLCVNDCCGINIKIEQKLQQHKHQPQNNNQCTVNNGPSDPVIVSQNGMHKKLKTPNDSFDSSSSSSGYGYGFDTNFLTKTKAVYEMYDQVDNFVQQNQHADEPLQSPPSHHNHSQSKILELQSKLIAQQNFSQQPHSNSHIPAISHSKNIQQTSQYQKSSKQLEQVLALRIDNENRLKAAQQSIEKSIKRPSQQGFDENSMSTQLGADQKENSKKIQQKLQEEMKQQCKAIKDKFLIEKVPVQQHYNLVIILITFNLFPENSLNISKSIIIFRNPIIFNPHRILIITSNPNHLIKSHCFLFCLCRTIETSRQSV